MANILFEIQISLYYDGVLQDQPPYSKSMLLLMRLGSIGVLFATYNYC